MILQIMEHQLLRILKIVKVRLYWPDTISDIAGRNVRLYLKFRKMDIQTNLIEPLLERAEAYSKTSVELIKLKALAKTADISSSLISKSLLALVVSFFAFLLNIAIALWLGDILGKNYYGFLIVAACYAIAAIIILIIHPSIKARVSNAIIKQLFN